MPRIVLTFPSTHYAIKAEATLLANGLAVKLIPVPREITADCGVAIECDVAYRERLLAAVEKEDIKIEGVHELD